MSALGDIADVPRATPLPRADSRKRLLADSAKRVPRLRPGPRPYTSGAILFSTAMRISSAVRCTPSLALIWPLVLAIVL
jgi:hypothetical protein